MVAELKRREKALGLVPDPVVDAYQKVSALEGDEHSILTDTYLQLLGLDVCADTPVGGPMVGASQRKGLRAAGNQTPSRAYPWRMPVSGLGGPSWEMGDNDGYGKGKWSCSSRAWTGLEGGDGELAIAGLRWAARSLSHRLMDAPAVPSFL
jgi:hypothetical protein